jgi:hypothetical protein
MEETGGGGGVGGGKGVKIHKQREKKDEGVGEITDKYWQSHCAKVGEIDL